LIDRLLDLVPTAREPLAVGGSQPRRKRRNVDGECSDGFWHHRRGKWSVWGTAPLGLWARRPSVWRVLGAGLLTPTSAARVCWLADVGLESPTYPDLRRARMLGAGLLTPARRRDRRSPTARTAHRGGSERFGATNSIARISWRTLGRQTACRRRIYLSWRRICIKARWCDSSLPEPKPFRDRVECHCYYSKHSIIYSMHNSEMYMLILYIRFLTALSPVSKILRSRPRRRPMARTT
jgi:hypothetical protein